MTREMDKVDLFSIAKKINNNNNRLLSRTHNLQKRCRDVRRAAPAEAITPLVGSESKAVNTDVSQT